VNVDWAQLVASVMAVGLAGYLLVALLKPEWFS
jgi:K+-transporting ATPase KdpF subunit